jgi:hypothetical protein
MPSANGNWPRGITIIALLMIVFGFAEIATGLTHNFLGIISTSDAEIASYAGAGIGAFYAISGMLVLTRKKWAAALAIALLIADVLGRIALVATGLFPIGSPVQITSIGIGTTIAIAFAVYISMKWTVLR